MTSYLKRPLSTFLKKPDAFTRTLILTAVALFIWFTLFQLMKLRDSMEAVQQYNSDAGLVVIG